MNPACINLMMMRSLLSVLAITMVASNCLAQAPRTSESTSRRHPLTLQHGSPWPKFRANAGNTGLGISGGSTGVPKWKFATKGLVTSSPAIAADGTIYFGSFDSNLYAVNRDGTMKWSYPTGNVVWGSPAIGSDGTIYFSSEDSTLYAMNPNGSKKWAFVAGGTLSSSPALGTDGTVYVGSWDNNLYAISSTGTKKWAYPTANLIGSSPAVGSDGTIYVGSTDTNLYALNANGTLKWKYPTQGAITTSPAIDSSGTVYFGSNDGNLYALNSDGTQKWHYSVGVGIGSSPAIGSDGTLYFGANDFNLYALTSSGNLKWTFPTGLQITSSPAIGSDGTIYFGSQDHFLYALNTLGKMVWSQATKGSIVSSPTIDSDGTLYVGSNDQSLYAFGTQVNTVPVSALSILPSSVSGGSTATATVSLSTSAPSTGDVVSLQCNDASVTLPAFVVVPGGAQSATFTIITSPVLANKTVTVTSSSGGTNAVATLTLTTGPISNLTVNPSNVVIGLNSFGSVTVSTPAPVGGTTINLASDNPNAVVPATITVAQGATTAGFTIQTTQASASLTATITASIGNYTRQATLKLTPIALLYVTVSNSNAVSGDTVQATATLNGPAPSAGVTIVWSSDSKSLVPPSSAKILKGQNSITVPIKIGMVSQLIDATLTAAYSGLTQSADLTIAPLVVTQVLLNPGSVTGGTGSTGTIELNGNGSGAATKVTLVSSSSSVIVPATVSVPANSKLVSFPIKTAAVAADKVASITAKTLVQPQSANLTVLAPSLSLMTSNPSVVVGGGSSNGTISVGSVAPVGGLKVALASSNLQSQVPSSVTIPAGKTFVNFPIKTVAVSQQIISTISATLNGSQIQTNLTINPPTLSGFSVSPTTVKGGNSAMGKVSLSSIAPAGGMTVTLSMQGSGASVPPSVTVPQGMSSAQFAISTVKVTTKANVILTATLGSNQKNVVLTIQ